MQVKCLKGTTKIVKGQIYDVRALYNELTRPVNRRLIYLKNFAGYNVSNFTMVDGTPLPNIQWNSPVLDTYLEPSEVKVNDILICLSNNYTYLSLNGMYRVIETQIKSYTTVYNNTQQYKYLVKFEGSVRFVEVSRYRFRQLTKTELREVGLQSVIDDKAVISKVPTIRKIDSVDNKSILLIQSLLKAASDKNRHAMGIIDWCCNQSSKKLKVKSDDYDELLKLPLSEIIKTLEG